MGLKSLASVLGSTHGKGDSFLANHHLLKQKSQRERSLRDRYWLWNNALFSFPMTTIPCVALLALFGLLAMLAMLALFPRLAQSNIKAIRITWVVYVSLDLHERMEADQFDVHHQTIFSTSPGILPSMRITDDYQYISHKWLHWSFHPRSQKQSIAKMAQTTSLSDPRGPGPTA